MPDSAKAKPKLSERLVDEIIDYIDRNNLKQGDKLPNEAKLMEITGAGRSSVREAMKLLASRNIVTIKQGSGTYVASTPGVVDDPLGFAFVSDKYRLALDMLEIRQILEPEIASMAAMRADDSDIENIMALCRRLEEISYEDNSSDAIDADFHEAVALASKNIVVPRLIPTISASVPLSKELSHGVRNAQSVDEHRLIAEAIADHDPMAAREAMYTHIYASRQNLKLALLHKDSKTENKEREQRESRKPSPWVRSLETSVQETLIDLFGQRPGSRSR